MKRLVLIATAFSMLAATSLQGQAAQLGPSTPQSKIVQVDWKKPTHRDVKKRVVVKRNGHGVVKKKVVVRHTNWKRGQRYSDWRRHQEVRDWQRHRLHRPGPGQEWIRVGNDYMLVSIVSGVIAGIIAANN